MASRSSGRLDSISGSRTGDRLAGRLAAVSVAVLVMAGTLGAQNPPKLGQVRAIHIAGQAEMLGANRQIAACLVEKLKAQGPFTFPESSADADAVLTWTAKIPGGAARVLSPRGSPQIRAELKTPDGKMLWKGENRFKKSGTLWGAHLDIPCGLADGLVTKLVKQMQKQQGL